jgi:lipoprotein-anchoring transpeptidase ErfK/SrfK
MKALEAWLAATGLAAVLCAQAFGQQDATAAHGPTTPEAPRRLIVVSLEDRKLALVEDGKVLKTYAVAVGKSSTPSPVGTYTIERRVANPTYSHNGKTVPPGPGNPVGTRWMGLSIHGYGIHGTNEPKSIGKAASHGCIRMAKADLEEFYGLVKVGDTVELVGQRNQATAALFGQPSALPAADAVETASNEPAIPEALRADAVADSNAAPDATVNFVEVR